MATTSEGEAGKPEESADHAKKLANDSQGTRPTTVIEEFLVHYAREFDYYRELARIAAQQCELGLERNGIRAMVTHRPKRPDRLRLKLLERASENANYKSLADIYADIVDLAGVRIALYFPGDRQSVHKLIEGNFSVKKSKADFPRNNAPYTYSFKGYDAVHFRVHLRENTLAPELKRYTEGLIEIQVASLLMHSWSEVEHDLIYKPLNGSVSEAEYAIIDELNGLVLAGEIALKRLQAAITSRAKVADAEFANHYELAAFIWDATQAKFASTGQFEPLMGRADLLLKFLELAKLNSPKNVTPYVADLDPNSENRALSEQVIDRILAEQPNLNNVFQEAKRILTVKNPYSSSAAAESSAQAETLGSFIKRWIEFETVLMGIVNEKSPHFSPRWTVLSTKSLAQLKLFDEQTVFTIDQLRRLRNQVVHGVEPADEMALRSASRELASLTRKISEMKPTTDPLGNGGR